MADKLDITVFPVSRLSVYGKDLRRIRSVNNLSRRIVCDRMNKIGYGYYPTKLMRYESYVKLTLSSSEMVSLISCLNGRFQLK